MFFYTQWLQRWLSEVVLSDCLRNALWESVRATDGWTEGRH